MSNPIRAAPKPRSKEKEAKFVPYEPYKAAITPICDPTGSKQKKKKSNPTIQTSQISFEKEENSITIEKKSANENSGTKSAAEFEKMESEIGRLERELAEKDKQIRIQTQVY